jgi:hypothetical protein
VERRTFLASVGLALLPGCARQQLHGEPDQLVLYSVDGPTVNNQRPKQEELKGELLYGYPVLGKVELKDRHQRREVLTALEAAVRDGAEKYKCFKPRHVVRTARAGVTTDMVICFECRNYMSYRNGAWEQENGTLAISDAMQPLLDKILTDAGVPLAPK